MGVKASLLAIVPTTNGLTAAETFGADYNGDLQISIRKCEEIINTLKYLVTDPLNGVGSEASNITALNAQITALS